MIEQLNKSCFCISLDQQALRQALSSAPDTADIFQLVQERCPNLFSSSPVFINAAHRRRMQDVIHAVEQVVALPGYRSAVLANAPAIAQHDNHGALGVFFGYDFHLHNGKLGLIEINTNAGGALLNAVLARAQRACCDDVAGMMPASTDINAFEQAIVAMFRQEWQRSGRQRPLQTIAIVDEHPEQQYLYAEFLLCQRLFQRHGLQAIIADPASLQWHNGKLWHQDMAIDLVYNRLTDFMLQAPRNAALREAYLHNAITLTPHPQAHALYADKRNLALLTDAGFLHGIGVPAAKQRLLLDNIPHTEVLNAADAERLWSRRKGLFFKPWSGYGSRAAYRGDKLTQRVWQEILQGDYIAQAIVAPGERLMSNEQPATTLKFDVRNYVYNGKVQWLSARLYQGQTTNFRTPGGGFAPVYSPA